MPRLPGKLHQGLHPSAVGPRFPGVPPCRLGGLLLTVLCLGCIAGPRGAGPSQPQGQPPRTFVYAGTAAGDIRIFELDPAGGDLTPRGRFPAGGVPVALAGDPPGQLLVAVLERGPVLALAVDPERGTLSRRGSGASGGRAPARASLDRSGKYALVSDSGRGSVAVLAIRPDRSLDPAEVFPAARGTSGLCVHASNAVVFSANQRAGTLTQFSFSAGTGVLTPRPSGTGGLPRGSSPRALACHPRGGSLFVLDESTDTISVYAYDDRMASLSHMAAQVVSTLPEGAEGTASQAVDLAIEPRGLYLYASNAGSDTVASFAVDAPGTGGLRLIGHEPSGARGLHELAMDPDGRFLVGANRGDRSLTLFRIDERSGAAVARATVGLEAAPRSLHVARTVPER